MMKTVKIKFVGFWKDFDYRTNPIYQAMIKHYNVELSDNPDYIICGTFDYYCYCNYPQVRIMYSGENYIPDFNFIDYGLSSYPISFSDRHIYFPLCLDRFDGKAFELTNKSREYKKEILENKPFFANLICSHESEHGFRGDFFKKLCQYKKVESPGTYLKNTEAVPGLSHLDGTKIAFQKKCKFSLCFESTKHYGFVTEKITDAFLSDTIPVYYGSSTVKDIFNEDAFIYIDDYKHADDAIKRIKELDRDDDLYLSVLRKPIFKNPDLIKDKFSELECFVKNIFDQPIEKAYRRSRVYTPKWHEECLLGLKKLLSSNSYKSDKKTLYSFYKKTLKYFSKN